MSATIIPIKRGTSVPAPAGPKRPPLADGNQAVVAYIAKGERSPLYYVAGDVRLFVVDENAPNDRVFEVTSRCAASDLRKLVRDGEPIGHRGDERHGPIAAKIEAYLDGRPHHLCPVGGDDA